MTLLENQLGPDPRSFEDSWTSMLTRLRAENEAWAANFTDSIANVASGGVNQLSNALAGAVLQTSDWRRELAQIPLLIGQEIVASLIKMALQYVIGLAFQKTAGKAAANAAVGQAAQVAAAWGTAATAASIATMGAAATVGLTSALIAMAAGTAGAAGMSSTSRFADGGETPGTPTLAWVGERGPELVIPAHVNAKLTPGQKASLVSGDIAAGGWPEGGRGASAPDGGRPEIPISIGVFDERRAMQNWLRESGGEAQVIDIMQRNWHRFTA